MTWGWVNYQDVFIWKWTNPLRDKIKTWLIWGEVWDWTERERRRKRDEPTLTLPERLRQPDDKRIYPAGGITVTAKPHTHTHTPEPVCDNTGDPRHRPAGTGTSGTSYPSTSAQINRCIIEWLVYSQSVCVCVYWVLHSGSVCLLFDKCRSWSVCMCVCVCVWCVCVCVCVVGSSGSLRHASMCSDSVSFFAWLRAFLH